jgi:DNA-binding NarL/FixJ family response regulator
MAAWMVLVRQRLRLRRCAPLTEVTVPALRHGSESPVPLGRVPLPLPATTRIAESFPNHRNAPPTTLIVDDHEIVREGLRSALRNDDGVDVVGLAADGAEALECARRWNPAVAIVDLHLPDMTGVELCGSLRDVVPGISVIILSSYLNEDTVRRSYAAGAVAYVTKAAGLGELRAALRVVNSAGNADRRRSVASTMRHLDCVVAERADSERPTPQQIRVLELLARGLTYGQISASLFISQSTVRYHVQHLKLKLGVGSRAELVVVGIRFGLLARPEDEALKNPW